MTLDEKMAIAMAGGDSVLAHFGLFDWEVLWSNEYKNVAYTMHEDKKIVFSKRFILTCTKDEFHGVLLHEIAHAIVGEGNGHNDKWRSICMEISGTDEYAVEKFKNSQILANKTIYCENCEFSVGTNVPMKELEEHVIGVKCQGCGSGEFNIRKSVRTLVEW